MKKEYTWLSDYKRETECHDGHFGHNCEFDFLPAFKKIDKLGGIIKVVDYYTIKIQLDFMNSGTVKNSIDVLLYCLAELPGITMGSFDKKKNILTLEWHY